MTKKQRSDELTATRVAAQFLQRLQAESQTWESEGRDAWAALSRLGGAALKGKDAEIIARRLYDAFPAFKAKLKQQDIALGTFCHEAGLGQAGQYSKELYRMLLPPGKTARHVGLRHSAAKYRKLLKAMSSVTGESTSTLADELLAGTTLHPANAEVRNDVEQVQLILQKLVEKVDEEFGLYRTFMETARLKAQHAAEGGKCRWPHYEAEYRVPMFEEQPIKDSPIIFEEPEEPDVTLNDAELEDEATAIQKELEAARKEHEAAMDTARAYWERPVSRRNKDYASWLTADHTGGGPSGCLQDDEFFYVPHCYLGYGEWSPGGEESVATRAIWRPELRKHVLKLYAEYGSEVVDGWNAEELRPQGQTTSLPDSYGFCQWHGWVVIYPTPDNSRLMPMLYVPGEEGGAILVPLDMITLHALRFSYWVSPNGEAQTIYERIKSLIGFREDEPLVMLDSFRRTAPWLQHNPFMKMARQQAADQELMRAFYSQLTQSSTQVAGHDTTAMKRTGSGQQASEDNEQ